MAQHTIEYRVGYLTTATEGYTFIELNGMDYLTSDLRAKIRDDFEMKHQEDPDVPTHVLTFIQCPNQWGGWHALEEFQENQEKVEWHNDRIVV
jgi:hypothetical protein